MSDLVERLTRAGGAMANLCYNLKQQTFGTERIRQQMDEAQTECDAALAEFPAVSAELSRLSALVAEWQKAGAEAEAQMMALYISVSPHATYERDGKIGNRFADEDHAICWASPPLPTQGHDQCR